MTDILIQFILYGGLYYTISILLNEQNRSILKVAQLLYASKEIVEQEQLNKISFIIEKQLKRITGLTSIVCWYDLKEPQLDWKRRYYRFVLLENIEYENRKKGKITLKSYIGVDESYFYYPIRTKENLLGAILLQLGMKQGIDRNTLLYLKYFSFLMVHQYKQLVSKQESSLTMELNLRNKIAQDMHDGLAQKLFFLSAQLFRMRKELYEQLSDEQNQYLDQIEERVKEAHQEVRGYIDYLQSRKKDIHILEAIKGMTEWIERTGGIQTKIEINGYVIEESVRIEEAVYHFIEEAATNVVKHSGAKELNIFIDITSIQWTIRVIDDGVGFSNTQTEQKKGKIGLIGMKERVQKVGGFLSIGSRSGIGTEIIAVIPRERGGVYEAGQSIISR